jgi:hypothetical protein
MGRRQDRFDAIQAPDQCLNTPARQTLFANQVAARTGAGILVE